MATDAKGRPAGRPTVINSRTTRLRPTGCPCGCMTKPPYIDDPDCIRYAPVSRWRGDPWPGYDVHDLGLACDHGPGCAGRETA